MTTERLFPPPAHAMAGCQPPKYMLAGPAFIRAMTAERARRGDLLAIAQTAAWRAENALHRHFTAKRMAYAEGRQWPKEPEHIVSGVTVNGDPVPFHQEGPVVHLTA